MSLLSRERLIVGLSPNRLGVLRHSTGWRHRLLEQYSTELAPDSSQPWLRGLEALELLLDKPAWGGREMTVVLSSHFVRYAVLPKGKHLGAVEQGDLARLIFRNIYGDLSRDWELRVSPASDRATLASGVPKALLAALAAACEGRATLRSVQPGLMTVFNRSRGLIDKQSGTLALVEGSRITLATIENGQWQAITSRAGNSESLPAMLTEAHTLSGLPTGGLLWLCDPSGKAVPPGPPWRIERLVTGIANATGLAGWGMA